MPIALDDDALAHLAIAATRIALALALGYTISWSLIGPVKEIERPRSLPATSLSAFTSPIATSWAHWRQM